MKRLFVILLSLVLLAACLPTPKQEYVVNKGDNVVEQKLSATPKPAEEPDAENTGDAEPVRQQFPDRWDADPIEVMEKFTIRPEAEIITKEDGQYPVYAVHNVQFTKEQEAKYIQAMLGTPTAVCEFEMTKEDYARQLQRFLDEVEEQRQWIAAGKPDWGDRDETEFTEEYIDDVTETIMAYLQKAPDELVSTPVSDYSGVELRYKQYLYTLQDGTKGYVCVYPTGFEIGKTCGKAYPYLRETAEEGLESTESEELRLAKNWKDPTVTREDAEQLLAKALPKLDLGDFTVRVAQEANLYSMDSGDRFLQAETSGWLFTLCRNPGGYPMPTDVYYEPSQNLSYGDGNDYVANAPIGNEMVTALVDENGLQFLRYNTPAEITGIVNPNVELLPWEEVQRRAIQSLRMCIPAQMIWNYNPDATIPLNIYRMLLTFYPVRQKKRGLHDAVLVRVF